MNRYFVMLKFANGIKRQGIVTARNSVAAMTSLKRKTRRVLPDLRTVQIVSASAAKLWEEP